MYKIVRHGKRFNNKVFPAYKDARKYVYTWAVSNKLAPTKEHVRMNDLGFTIKKI